MSMIYATSISYSVLSSSSSRRNRRGSWGMNTNKSIDFALNAGRNELLSRDEKQNVSFALMISCAVGAGVFFLLVFHLYLAASAQTTIEFHGNFRRRKRARHRGVIWTNPYDLGWKRNLMQIYGELTIWALMPSRKEPPYLPLPIPGPKGKRKNFLSKKNEAESAEGGLNADDLESGRGVGDTDDTPLLLRGNRQKQKQIEITTV